MGKAQKKNNIVIDNALYERKSNDIDNASVEEMSAEEIIAQEHEIFDYNKYLKDKVCRNISEYRLGLVVDYLFAHNIKISDCADFINSAIKQIERFMNVWLNDLDDETRKIIINHNFYGGKEGLRPYKDFAESPLWKYESSIFKVLNRFTCSECGKQYCPPYLVVHHLSYKHLGSEILHPEDVTVLCMACLGKVHRTGEKNEQER